jgi:hypothetical protein
VTNVNEIPAITEAPGFRQNEPLAEKTTLAIGGPAAYYVEAQDEEAVCQALAIAEQHKLDLTVEALIISFCGLAFAVFGMKSKTNTCAFSLARVNLGTRSSPKRSKKIGLA